MSWESDRTFVTGEIFVDRVEEIRELVAWHSSGHRFAQITGSAGVGKTALALIFCREHAPGQYAVISPADASTLLAQVQQHAGRSGSLNYLIIDNPRPASAHEFREVVRTVLLNFPEVRVLHLAREPMEVGLGGPTIRLGPLPETAIIQFLRSNLGDTVDDRFIRWVVAKTGGFPALLGNISGLIREDKISPEDVLRGLEPFRLSGLIAPDGSPLGRSDKRLSIIRTDITNTDDELLKLIDRNPSIMQSLSPRRFEELVAEIMNRLGYEVSLTPISKDGGIDIFAASKNELGSFLYVVQCKKHSLSHPVGVAVVRDLYGVLQAERATAGLVVTTSRFTSGAKGFQSRVRHQVALKDYLAIHEWVRQVAKKC